MLTQCEDKTIFFQLVLAISMSSAGAGSATKGDIYKIK